MQHLLVHNEQSYGTIYGRITWGKKIKIYFFPCHSVTCLVGLNASHAVTQVSLKKDYKESTVAQMQFNTRVSHGQREQTQALLLGMRDVPAPCT